MCLKAQREVELSSAQCRVAKDQQMNTEAILDEVGDFTWNFGSEFFVETSKGNFIWSDPDYGGDNTLTRFVDTYRAYDSENNFRGGRSKGKHVIRSYCSDKVKVMP